tara:strand:- start:182 stop:1108 length:927 start_codon:yes stop_codon:yes gene_type:complete
MNKYKVAGLVIETEIDFPELIEIEHSTVDYIIKYGNVPDILGGNSSLIVSGRNNDIEYYYNNNQVLYIREIFHSPYLFKCLIDNNEIIVHNDLKGVNIKYYRRLLLGSILSIFSFKKNLYPIHGGGISYKGESFIILGKSGAGKSTLNMLLQERGFKTIGDDILNIYIEDKKSYVHPGIPAAFLKKNTIDILKKLDSEKIILRKPKWKTTFSTIDNFDNNIRQIRKIYYLLESDEDIFMSNIDISKKKTMISNTGYSSMVYRGIDSKKHDRMVTDIVNSTEIVEFKRPFDMDRLDDSVDFILNDIKNT